jgi:hypothetical protein
MHDYVRMCKLNGKDHLSPNIEPLKILRISEHIDPLPF